MPEEILYRGYSIKLKTDTVSGHWIVAIWNNDVKEFGSGGYGYRKTALWIGQARIDRLLRNGKEKGR